MSIGDDMINDLAEAVSFFIGKVDGHETGRERAAVKISNPKGALFYVLFKRLGAYGRLFPQEKGKGYGQSVSLSILEKAAMEEANIIIIFSDGKMYSNGAQEWLDYAHIHKTIRQARDGDITASVPSRWLRRLE